MSSRGLRRTLSDFNRHPWLHALSICTISVALVMIGGFFTVARNFNSIAERTTPQVTGTVYLKEDLSAVDIQHLREKILGLEHVRKVTFKPKKSVVDELQAFLGGTGTEVMPGGELFPDVLEIELLKSAPAGAVVDLKAILSRFPEAAEVDFSDDWLQQYRKARQFITWVGILLTLGLVIGCSFIIANFMGMRHEQRRHEIEVVNLIGADRQFVLSPFIWEGITEGILGTAFAVVLLYGMLQLITTVLKFQWAAVLGVEEWLFLSVWQLILLMSIGIAMAMFGGISVYWRVQKSASR